METQIHSQISVAVDVLIFTIAGDTLKIVLTQRETEPFLGMYALPGGALREEETPDAAAERAVAQRTGLTGIYLEQLYTFGEIDRDPRSRTISVAYYALTDPDSLASLPLNEHSGLFSVDEIISGTMPVGFDHKEQIRFGQERLRGKVMYSDIAFEFVPDEFTLPQLQRVYEILLGEKLYKANFRKMIAPRVEDTGNMLTGAAHRPSRMYRKK
ncbi:MAG: NUDIX hydrolase [Oscillospiraceae bacterium]|nr:NUDIX hydrolase [Oscillospiraceae bacterium]